MKSLRVVSTLILAVGWIMLFTSCAATYQTRSVEPSGFLKDYSMMREGKKGEALLVYINPNAQFPKYKKILMEPVKAYSAEDSRLAKMAEEDRSALLNYLDATIREQLGQDYQFVKEPGPDVMRLRVALCDAKGAKVVLNTISSIVPVGIAISTLQRVAVGTHTAVAQTHIEMEILDSMSGERLAAAVDERASRKYTFHFDKFSKWKMVRDAFDWWAVRMCERLADVSGPKGTTTP